METATAAAAPVTPAADSPTSYDQVPYESRPFRQAHPDRMAVVATLAGLTPPPVPTCRVLELACAAGGNLIPLAVAHPGTSCVGVDLSAVQIEDGKRVVQSLGLKNVDLRRMDIMEVGPDLGQFDFIIAHGVFSWIPPAVQDKMFEICAGNLAPNGLAYLSYNTLPGWRTRGIIRDMMSYHGRRFTDPQQRVGQAKAMLEFAVKACEGQNTPYANLLREELKLVQSVSDWYLYHEHLEDDNRPMYFHEFVERAAPFGLRYLGEADAFTMAPRVFPPEVQQVLSKISPDIIHLEQYMDFLRNRMFRQTILCRAELTPNYNLTPQRARDFAIACTMKPSTPDVDVTSAAEAKYQSGHGATLTTRAPVVKAAVAYLTEQYPRPVPFAALCDAVAERLNLGLTGGAQVADALGLFVLNTYTTSNVLDLTVTAPAFTLEPGERPVASPLARHQAATSNTVTTLRHEMVNLVTAQRQLLLLLDGTLDREALGVRLVELVEKGVLGAQKDGKPVTDMDEVRSLTRQSLPSILNSLARCALLTA
jgi:methyltransferase-like protein